MLVLRGTKKLRDRLKGTLAGGEDASTTVLGDWFATVLFWKPQVVLLVNERTLLSVFMPFAPAATLTDRIPEAIATLLRHHGADDAFVAAELEAMRDVRIAPTNNRSVLGVMNETAAVGERVLQRSRTDLDALSMRMSEVPRRPLVESNGSPERELAAVLHPEESNVIRFPRQPAVQPPPAPRSARTANAFQLKATLQGIKPPVWRRILVRASIPLDQLHEVVQAAFGWWNYHLHEFEIGRTSYGVPDPDDDFGPPVRKASRTRLDAVATVGDSFNYTYGFGDGWEHAIVVEKSIPITPDLTVPACIDGRRACPPEDCGGPWGYGELLTILADPSHPEYEARVEWVGAWGGGTLDPEAFDPAEFADNLDSIRLATFD